MSGKIDKRNGMHPDSSSLSSSQLQSDGLEYWYVCDIHRVKWLGWKNEWDWWSEELEAQWEKNHSRLLGYKSVNLPRSTADANPELVQDSAIEGDLRQGEDEFFPSVESMFVGTRLLRVR